MKTILFNIHDLVLMLTVGICAVLAGILAIKPDSRNFSSYLLACFFVLNAFIALDKLIFWGEAVKYRVFDLNPHFMLVFGFAFFAVGPVLYWYCNSKIQSNFSLSTRNYLHLLPAALTPVYLYFACFQYPLEIQRELLLEAKIYDQPGVYFSYFTHLKKLLPLIYGGLTLFLITHAQKSKTGPGSNTKPQEITWLKTLVVGFTLVWLWALVTHIYGLGHPGALSDLMGIVDNYLTLVLIVILLFINLSYPARQEENDDEIIDPEHVKQIHQLMETEKPYLNPRLTLDRFANMVNLSPRQVSSVVNRSFDQNFHEYINRYRVDEAKRILGSTQLRHLSIQDVAQMAGFNSKATFHRLFKNMETQTPSEYRQNTLSAATDSQSHQL